MDQLLNCIFPSRKTPSPIARPRPVPSEKIITGRLTAAELEEIRMDEASSPPNHVPSLPPELLRQIIMHATDTHPSPFSIHRSTPLSVWDKFPFPTSHRLDPGIERKLHTRSMQRKVTISRVSKAWRDITVEFLFNSIRIDHAKQIPLLGMAFDADESRNGLQGGAIQGSAAGWVREIWFDLDRVRSTSSDLPLEFDLPDLFQRCPNVVVFRGFGHRLQLWHQAGLFKKGQIVRSIVPTACSDRPVVYEPLNILEGRRIEISRLVDHDPFIPLIPPPTSPELRPSYLLIQQLQSLELHPSRTFYEHSPNTFATICLPHLTHLFIHGLWGAARYATLLEMPNIRSITYDAISTDFGPDQDPFQVLMKRHGAKLKELALLHAPDKEELLQIQEHCTNLETMYITWAHANYCPKTVTTVGLFGLEDVVNDGCEHRLFASVTALLDAALALREVKDLSWRSGVVRQRAARSRKDPAASRYRKFWADFIKVFRRGEEEVRLVDWRGRIVDAGCFELDPGEDRIDEDDRTMEQLAAGSI